MHVAAQALALAGTTPAHALVVLPESGCGEGQLAMLQSAADTAGPAVFAALSNAQSGGNATLSTWFGESEPIRILVTEVLTRMNETMLTGIINAYCGGCADPNDIAVRMPERHHIRFCDRYFALPATGADSHASTIAHELAHYDREMEPGDFCKTYAECKLIPEIEPGRLGRLAGSYEYFVAEFL